MSDNPRGAFAQACPATAAGQIVLVFQGGGALGAYQAGVYQALHESESSRTGSSVRRSAPSTRR